jgi:hypothetical protein
MDVVKSVWTAACTQSGEGALPTLVNKVEGTAVAKVGATKTRFLGVPHVLGTMVCMHPCQS